MNDKIRITLQMAGFSFPLTIDREEEERVRLAAKQVDLTLNAYREHFSKLPKEQLLTMVAYHHSLQSLKEKERNDTLPVMQRIETLSQLLDEYFRAEG